MMPNPRKFSALLLLAILIGSCTRKDSPTDVGRGPLLAPVRASVVSSPANQSAAPIDQVRVVIVELPGRNTIGTLVADVDPAADSWDLTVEGSWPEGAQSISIEVTVELVNSAAGSESVEYSGLAGPITFNSFSPTPTIDIDLVRGPLANAYVTAVSIQQAPDTLVVGASATVSAAATTSGTEPPVLFWDILDTSVVQLNDTVVTALAEGSGRVVVSAGAFSDTATVVVIRMPTAVSIAPDTVTVVGVGMEGAFTATVTDAQDQSISGVGLIWRSSDPSVVESLGDGVFRSTGVGEAAVDVLVAADTTIRTSGLFRALSTDTPDASLTLRGPAAPPVDGDTATVTVVLSNPSGPNATELTGLEVANTVAGAALLSATASVGTFTPGTGVWAVPSLSVGDSAILTLDLEVPVGSGGSTLTESASITAIDQVDGNPGNDSDNLSLTVAPRPVDVVVAKSVDEPNPLPDSTVNFSVTVTNNGPGPVSNVRLVDVLAPVFLTPNHAVSAGTLQGDTLWTIPLLDAGASETWTTSATVDANAGGDSTSNRAALVSLEQNDTTPVNDAMTVSMSFPFSALPVVTISAPADSAVFDPGDLVTFSGSASDAEDGTLSGAIAWTSSVDGAIGLGPSFETDQLSTGAHTIVASVADSDGGVGADTISIVVALYSIPATLNIPFGGSASLPITLSEPAPTGGVTLSVTSSSSGTTSPTAPTVFIPEGSQSANATLIGSSPGTATVTVSNAQFGAIQSSVTVSAELTIPRTSFTMGSAFTETISFTFRSQGTPIGAPAGGLPVTLTSADPTCAAPTTPVVIPEGQTGSSTPVLYGGSATLPCTVWVTASSPAVLADSVQITVVAPPVITVGPRTVGSGLQTPSSFSLPLSNHGGVTVTLTSPDAGTLLLAPDASTAGTASIDIFIPDGSASSAFFIQGVESATGSVDVVATAAGFTDGAGTMSVVQPGITLTGLAANTTTLTADDEVYASVGVPSGNTVSVQNIRAGGNPVTVTFTTDNTGVGVITDGVNSGASATATVPIGLYYSPTTVATGGVAHDPVGIGTANISVSAPGFIAQPNATLPVTVSAPGITVGARTVGSGLQNSSSFSLGASNHGGVTVTLTSPNATTLLLAPDASTAGTASIDIFIPDGSASSAFFIQGVEGATGSVDVAVTATGFTDGSATMTVVQPGIVLSGLNGATTTLTADDEIYASIGIPSGNTVSVQNVRAGGSPVTVTFTTDDTGVGVITDGVNSGPSATATVPIGLYYSPTTVATGGVAHDPVGIGTANISVSAPGFIAQPNATLPVTVSAPGITVGARTVGSGLQNSSSFSLGTSNHGGVTVTLRSLSPNTARVAPDASTPGTDSIQVFVPNGSASVGFYVQGMEGAAAQTVVAVSAAGFTDGSATMTVVQPGIVLSGLSSTSTVGAPADEIYASVGIPSGNTVSVQNVRAGGNPVTVTFTTDNTGVGVITDGVNSGASATATVPIGLYYSPTTVATGGVAHDPVGIGTANISVSAPGFIVQPNAAQSVTISN